MEYIAKGNKLWELRDGRFYRTDRPINDQTTDILTAGYFPIAPGMPAQITIGDVRQIFPDLTPDNQRAIYQLLINADTISETENFIIKYNPLSIDKGDYEQIINQLLTFYQGSIEGRGWFANEIKKAALDFVPMNRHYLTKTGEKYNLTSLAEIYELAELGMNKAYAEIAKGTKSMEEKFDAMLQIYNTSQFTYSFRDTDREAMQQFSTPQPLGYLMQWYVHAFGENKAKLLFDPTAGNGSLIFASEIPIIANELDQTRYDNLRQYDAKIYHKDATDGFVDLPSVDAIVMNPPFCATDKKGMKVGGYVLQSVDHIIAAQTMEIMAPAGRAAIIFGGNIETDEFGVFTRAQYFLNYLFQNYNVADIINLGKSIFYRMGTTFPTTVVLVQGRKTEKVLPPIFEPDPEFLKPVETFPEILERFKKSYDNPEYLFPQKTRIDRTKRNVPLPIQELPLPQRQTGMPGPVKHERYVPTQDPKSPINIRLHMLTLKLMLAHQVQGKFFIPKKVFAVGDMVLNTDSQLTIITEEIEVAGKKQYKLKENGFLYANKYIPIDVLIYYQQTGNGCSYEVTKREIEGETLYYQRTKGNTTWMPSNKMTYEFFEYCDAPEPKPSVQAIDIPKPIVEKPKENVQKETPIQPDKIISEKEIKRIYHYKSEIAKARILFGYYDNTTESGKKHLKRVIEEFKNQINNAKETIKEIEGNESEYAKQLRRERILFIVTTQRGIDLHT